MPTNQQTGEPQDSSGWSQDDPSKVGDANAGAKALQSSILAQQNKYSGAIDPLLADAQKQYETQEKAESPYREKLLKILESPAAAHAHLEKAADAPKPEDYQKYSTEFAGSMAVLGAIAGRFTRQGGTAALNAFAGALKGWQQGNLEVYETKAKEWEQNTKKTMENNELELQKYKEIMDDKKSNIDQMMAAMNLVSSQYQNKIMFDFTMAKNYTAAFGMVDKLDGVQQRLTTATEKLTGLHTQQNEAVKAQVNYLNEHPDQLSRMPMKDYLKLKGAAETLGYPLNDHPSTFLPSTAPRNAPAMALQQYIEETTSATGKPPTSKELVRFNAGMVGEQAEARTEGAMSARVDTAANEVQQALPLAVEASRNLPRGQYVPWNTLQQRWDQGTSDPAYNDFVVKNFALMNAYTRAMNPQGIPRINDRLEQHANGILSMATSPEAYEVQARALWQEVVRSKGAVAKTRGEIGQDSPQNEPYPVSPKGSNGGGSDPLGIR
jgi:hypothetical protein